MSDLHAKTEFATYPKDLEISGEEVRINSMRLDEKNQIKLECSFGHWADDESPRRWVMSDGAMIFYARPEKVRGLLPGDLLDFRMCRWP